VRSVVVSSGNTRQLGQCEYVLSMRCDVRLRGSQGAAVMFLSVRA
jgi:hypothetical protein